ncbi:alpha/beta hydrolase [Amycolatopsis sp. FBCC-B4732]|uniref:alpha/beta hydrolase n=1 Tax=Amycolatopsis sp. FBCC-B4732 TaxID=3079339 RepID=UPI001FF6E2B7|nr:alpha/beta hydrolase [Amycolatopsis sp. FBCC-B4732]UOX85045.1 alpha/beta hydrolase [Amycolatopsis sp. FBCC-B4732]
MRKILLSLAFLPVLAAPPAEAAPSPKWTVPCPDYGLSPSPTAGLECATLRVPLDYAHPERTIELTLSRRAGVPGKRRGVLLMNPGGPGSPGLAMPAQLARRMGGSGLPDAYDVIGFDPRGTGYSTPVTCDLTPEPRGAVLGPYAEGPRDVAATAAKARAVARQCATASTKDLLPHMTTANTARDLDRIREALGEEKISYYGVSYGSYLGAAYASMFPGRGYRIVLDSVLGPGGLDYRAQLRFAEGFDDRFPDFAAWAARRDDGYHLGRTEAAVTAKFFALAAARGPGFRAGTWNALYDDALFPVLAADWAGTARAAGGPLDGDNHAALQLQVLCNDSDWPGRIGTYQLVVERERRRHPMFGPAAANVNPCAFWPAGRAEPAVRVGGPGPANVLLVQNLRDPATPLSGARETRAAFGSRARLVTVDAGGHGVFTRENACGNRLVLGYLRDGVFPAADGPCR